MSAIGITGSCSGSTTEDSDIVTGSYSGTRGADVLTENKVNTGGNWYDGYWSTGFFFGRETAQFLNEPTEKTAGSYSINRHIVDSNSGSFNFGYTFDSPVNFAEHPDMTILKVDIYFPDEFIDDVNDSIYSCAVILKGPGGLIDYDWAWFDAKDQYDTWSYGWNTLYINLKNAFHIGVNYDPTDIVDIQFWAQTNQLVPIVPYYDVYTDNLEFLSESVDLKAEIAQDGRLKAALSRPDNLKAEFSSESLLGTDLDFITDATVYADGDYAGTWYNPGLANTYSLDTVDKKYGSGSIKAVGPSSTTLNSFGYQFDGTIDISKYEDIYFWFKVEAPEGDPSFRPTDAALLIVDSDGDFYKYYEGTYSYMQDSYDTSDWVYVKIPLSGYDLEYGTFDPTIVKQIWWNLSSDHNFTMTARVDSVEISTKSQTLIANHSVLLSLHLT